MVQSQPSSVLADMLLRQSPGCMWVLPPNQVFEAVYGNAPRVFGRPMSELAGSRFADVVEPQARERWSERIERVLGGCTVCALSRFGERASVYSVTLFPVKEADGRIAFAGGLANEIAAEDATLRVLGLLEHERRRVSTLLHDHVGQYLSAAGLQLDLLRMDMADAAFPQIERASQIQATLETVMGTVRDLSHEMNPAAAERVGLRVALDQLAGRLRAEFKGTVRAYADATAHPPPQAAAALYQIAREAACNAMKHTGCSAVEILLKAVRGGTELEVRDNGRGMDAAEGASPGRGLGLLVMQYHSEQAGIELEIYSEPDGGTVVRALWASAEEA